MPGSSVLIVLVVRETGLRSALTARLSMAGADVLTARDVHDPALQRSVRRPAILVVDAAILAGRPAELLAALLAEPKWQRIVALADAAEAVGKASDPRLIWLDRAGAPAALAALVEGWRAGE